MTPKPFKKPIYVTRPFLPPLADFTRGLQEVWDSGWLTNNGPVLQRFRGALAAHFETPNLSLFSNGTLALQLALHGMRISGEVITTPFTFVATAHALFWNRLSPVFVDIEPRSYTLDPARVEAAITPRTSAILAVHVYGFPCRLAELADIARRHRLALLYDAAHAFGVTVDGRSIAHQGDLSMFSFHATKHFHSIEGGLVVFPDPALGRVFDLLKNFGFENETSVAIPGTNAKMNELQALMGLQVLQHLEAIIARRRALDALYRGRLAGIPGLLIPDPPPPNVRWNHAYFPVEIDAAVFGMKRDRFVEQLKRFNIHARRYFHPLLTDLECYRDVPHTDPLTVARRVANRILTLPIYDSLPLEDADRICDCVKSIAPGNRGGGRPRRTLRPRDRRTPSRKPASQRLAPGV
jgi:dTDP-4-amino-4,6-dideoxygalactose transaminase